MHGQIEVAGRTFWHSYIRLPRTGAYNAAVSVLYNLKSLLTMRAVRKMSDARRKVRVAWLATEPDCRSSEREASREGLKKQPVDNTCLVGQTDPQ